MSNKKPNVIIEILGGVATIDYCDPGLIISIRDYDDIEDFEESDESNIDNILDEDKNYVECGNYKK